MSWKTIFPRTGEGGDGFCSLISCCVAQFLTDHGQAAVLGPGVGDPCSSEFSCSWCFARWDNISWSESMFSHLSGYSVIPLIFKLPSSVLIIVLELLHWWFPHLLWLLLNFCYSGVGHLNWSSHCFIFCLLLSISLFALLCRMFPQFYVLILLLLFSFLYSCF